MPNMSSEQLRDISIRVVEGFLNDKVPLSEGLAKQAAANDLNSDQVQRCVEACNTISFLKIMGASKDRTFEFPLCDYSEVMQNAAVPSIVKVAYQTLPQSEGDGYAGAMTKAASVTDRSDLPAQVSAPPQFSEAERVAFMIKEAAANHRAVEDLETRSVQLHAGLLKVAAEVKQDSLALDKMACAVEPSNVAALTSLVFGQAQAVPDFGAGAGSMFKQAELKAVATLQDLYKEAKLVRDELHARRGLDKRASELQSELTKQAFAPAIAAGRLLGGLAGSAAAGVGRIAAAPITSIAKGTANATKRAFGFGNPTPKSTTAKVVGGLAGVGLNSATINTHAGYNPSGSSRDVWEALQ